MLFLQIAFLRCLFALCFFACCLCVLPFCVLDLCVLPLCIMPFACWQKRGLFFKPNFRFDLNLFTFRLLNFVIDIPSYWSVVRRLIIYHLQFNVCLNLSLFSFQQFLCIKYTTRLRSKNLCQVNLISRKYVY